MDKLQIVTPRWTIPLLKPKRYKGARGGRGSGKSHFFAEALVEQHIINPDFRSVCIREIQRSLKFSAKQLIEDKIKSLGVSHLFDITLSEIKRVDHKGLIIFEGMQDHTADSIKSIEGFNIAWVEEAQSISHRSLQLLKPTIRTDGSEIWFSWNPENEDDPVEELFKGDAEDTVLVHVNYTDNPFLPETLKKEAERDKKYNPDSYPYIWLGDFNKKSKSRIFADKFIIEEFDDDLYKQADRLFFGSDFGFAEDPSTLIRCFILHNNLYIEYEAYGIGVELDEMDVFYDSIPESRKWPIKGDNSRPETISHIKKQGFNISAAKKWQGSVEDGIGHLRSFKNIIIHKRCKHMADEARLYSYKIDKKTNDILPIVVDKHNHCWDAVRYALDGYITRKSGGLMSLA